MKRSSYPIELEAELTKRSDRWDLFRRHPRDVCCRICTDDETGPQKFVLAGWAVFCISSVPMVIN